MNLPTHLKIYRRAAKDAEGRKGEILNFGFWILNEGYGCHTYISSTPTALCPEAQGCRRQTATLGPWRE